MGKNFSKKTASAVERRQAWEPWFISKSVQISLIMLGQIVALILGYGFYDNIMDLEVSK
jgi:hypothetical protein